MRIEIKTSQCVGEAVLPAGDRCVVVTHILRIPAHHHVAEAKATVDGTEKLVLVQVLATQNPVDVTDRDLDFIGTGFSDGGNGSMFIGACHCSSCGRVDRYVA